MNTKTFRPRASRVRHSHGSPTPNKMRCGELASGANERGSVIEITRTLAQLALRTRKSVTRACVPCGVLSVWCSLKPLREIEVGLGTGTGPRMRTKLCVSDRGGRVGYLTA